MANGARSFLIKFIGDSKHLQGETDAVTGRLGKIKAAVGEADGVFGKLKAGGGAALQGVGGAGAVAAAGVAAAAAAAAKGLMDFQNLGLEIGKGAEATGLSAEAFSRWKEVAADAGIEQAGLEGTIGKFNKTLGATPGVVAGFGVEIVKAKDGTTDVNETFLNAIDTLNAIKDPAERAEAGAKLFGRSWQGMAEIISRGSGQLRTDLAAVSDAKVFDDSKVEDARKLRDAFDQIKDAGEDLFLVIGETLAPVVADLAPMLADAVEQVKPLAKGFGDLISGALQLVGPLLDLSNALLGPLAEGLGKALTFVGGLVGGLGDMVDAALGGGTELEGVADQVTEQATAQREARDAIVKTNESFDDAAAKAEYYASRVEAATDKTIEMTDAYDELAGELADTKSWIDAQQAVLSYKEKVDDATASNLDKQAALVDVKSKLLDYVSSLQGVPPEKQTAIIALIDAGKIEEAEAALAVLARPRDAVINPRTGGQAPVADRRAAGGPVTGGRAYLVGDNPDGSINETTELFVPNGSGQILNPRDTRRALAASARTADDGPASGGGLTVIVQLAGPVLGVDQLEQTIRDAALRAFDERARQNRGNT